MEARFARVFALARARAPAEARELLEKFTGPTVATLVAVAFAAWAASHFFGLGELVDLVLLATAGLSAYQGAKALWRFADLATHATAEQDLEASADALLEAIALLGAAAIGALFGIRAIRRVPHPDPSYGPRALFVPGQAGSHVIAGPDAGKIHLNPGLKLPTLHPASFDAARPVVIPLREAVLRHELSHRMFTCRTTPFRALVNPVRRFLYQESSLWRWFEEAFAETRAVWPYLGPTRSLRWGLAFPYAHGYLRLSKLGEIDMVMMAAGLGTSARALPDDWKKRLTLDWQPLAGAVLDSARWHVTLLFGPPADTPR